MTVFISMLRGINVSGQKRLLMDDLRNLYEALGLANVTSYVQSGNVVFTSPEQDATALAGRIEAQIEKTFGYQVPVMIRTTADFERVLGSNPFLTDRKEDPIRLYVTFVYRTPTPEAWSRLILPASTNDEFSIGEQEIFLFCPKGYGTSKLNNTFFEKKLKMPSTTRNWNSVKALYALAKQIGEKDSEN